MPDRNNWESRDRAAWSWKPDSGDQGIKDTHADVGYREVDIEWPMFTLASLLGKAQEGGVY